MEVDRNFEDPDTGVVGKIRRDPKKPVPEYNEARQAFLQVEPIPRSNVISSCKYCQPILVFVGKARILPYSGTPWKVI